mgnify:CR=1 FL=1
MREARRRGLKVAAATGMVMTMMTGCGSTVPEGDQLYWDGEKHYTEYATVMHSVIMSIDEGPWRVDSYGASPIPCDRDGGDSGYMFSWVRVLAQDAVDAEAVEAAATAAFEKAGLDAETATFGEGDRQEINIIGTGAPVGRGVVTIRPARATIEVTAETDCFAGDAGDLSDLIFDGLVYKGASQRFPAFEGPDWQPRFYFPEDGSPVYRNADGTPVEPQPTTTDFPVAPYAK